MSEDGALPVADEAGAWMTGDTAVALSRACAIADENAQAAIAWYRKAMRWRGRFARALRLVALALFGAGGLVPIAKAYLPKINGAEPTELGYVALAVGAGLLAFDYFFGITSAYTRFVTTEMAIRHARLAFRTDWLALVAGAGAPAAGASLEPFLARLKAYVAEVAQLVDRETREWVAEFRSSLSELEKLGNRAPRSTPPKPLEEEAPPAPEPPAAAGAARGDGAAPGPSA